LKLSLIAASVLSLAAGPAPAGSIGSLDVNPGLEWTSKCVQPTPPVVSFHDVLGYNQALEAFNLHVTQMRSYYSCVQSEGKADIDAVAATISKGMQQRLTAAGEATEKVRAELELQRSLLK